MPKRKLYYTLSTRQKRRRHRQQLAIDLEENNELDNDVRMEQSTDSYSISNDVSSFPPVDQNPEDFEPGHVYFRHQDDGNETVPQGNPPSNLSDIPNENVISVENSRPLSPSQKAEHNLPELNSLDDTGHSCPAAVQTSSMNEEFSFSSELAQWVTQCYVPHVSVNLLLRLLRTAGHSDLPMDSRSLMRTPRTSGITELTQGSYIHFGLKNALTYQLANSTIISLNSEIQLDINVDGLPLTKSSHSSLWPILGRIVHPGFHTPFIIGAYHYYAKPSSVQEFLAPFVEEYVQLHTEGFYHEGTKYIISIRAVICDSPARCFVTCTKQYNGYYGCPKCTTEGTYLKFVTFPDLEAPLRTDEDFRNRSQKEHHTGTSPFEAASLNMVSQFPLDYMHVILLGVMKKLFLLWLKRKGVFGAFARKQLSRLLILLRKWIPREFSRKPRGINELGMWKATEFRLFLLYVGSSVLRNLLPDTHLQHFNALSCACRILCDQEDCIRNNKIAKDLLIWFVRRYVVLYGAEEMVSNIHNLIHINEDVKLFGPLNAFSAFPFENFMQKLKKLLKSPVNPLQQLHRRLTEMVVNTKPFDECPKSPIFLKSIPGNLPLRCHRPHAAVKFPLFYLSTKQPDNCCYLEDGSPVVIKHIGYRDEVPVILGCKFEQLSAMRLYPFDSRLINVNVTSDKLSGLRVWSISEITRKAIMFPINKAQFNVMPLLQGLRE